jgi:nucleotidyltransferase AbiEii toxin of type IV toxin-antitoxin system
MPQKVTTDYKNIRLIAIAAIFSDDLLFEKVVLKGGNALSLVLGISLRTSLDLDFSIEADFDDPEDIKRRIFTSLEERFRAEGYTVFDLKFEPKPTVVRDGQDPRWGGYVVKFKLMERAKFDGLKNDMAAAQRDALVIGPGDQRVFTIDLSKYEYTTGKLEAEVNDYAIYVYSPEMIAIEKLRAICQQMPEYDLRGHPAPRARDFFDIHLVVSKKKINLGTEENLVLARNIFKAKGVPVALLAKIPLHREFHRPDWESVKTSTPDVLKDFDHYFDFVVAQSLLLKTLWEE